MGFAISPFFLKETVVIFLLYVNVKTENNKNEFSSSKKYVFSEMCSQGLDENQRRIK